MSKKSWLVCGILAAMMGCLTLQAKTFQEIRADAEKGDADAQFELALYYNFGVCGPKDEETAKQWCIKAARQGHRAAFATCLEEGYGMKKDSSKSKELLRQAAENGDVWAQFCFGISFIGTNENKQAVFWLRKAAEQGNSWAQLFFCLNYVGITKNKDITVNPQLGIEFCTKSAMQGNALGQMLLGSFYARGEGVEKDLTKATYWLRKAAEQGNEQAKAALKQLGE